MKEKYEGGRRGKKKETTKQCMFLQTEQIAAKTGKQIFFCFRGVSRKGDG